MCPVACPLKHDFEGIAFVMSHALLPLNRMLHIHMVVQITIVYLFINTVLSVIDGKLQLGLQILLDMVCTWSFPLRERSVMSPQHLHVKPPHKSHVRQFSRNGSGTWLLYGSYGVYWASTRSAWLLRGVCGNLPVSTMAPLHKLWYLCKLSYLDKLS